MKQRTIWRRAVSIERHMNKGWEKSWATGGSNIITLNCGHLLVRKLSQRIPDRYKCAECTSLRNGSSTKTTRPNATNTFIVETWDHQSEMPKHETRPMTDQEIAEWNDWEQRSTQAHKDDAERRAMDKADRIANQHMEPQD